MISESEYEFEPFLWEGQSMENLEQSLHVITNTAADSPIEAIALSHLFRNVAEVKEWHDDTQKAEVTKFQALVQTLETNLTDLQVYRVGTTEIDVYIVGKSESGTPAGLHTKLIET
jgi:hypothetical protein